MRFVVLVLVAACSSGAPEITGTVTTVPRQSGIDMFHGVVTTSMADMDLTYAADGGLAAVNGGLFAPVAVTSLADLEVPPTTPGMQGTPPIAGTGFVIVTALGDAVRVRVLSVSQDAVELEWLAEDWPLLTVTDTIDRGSCGCYFGPAMLVGGYRACNHGVCGTQAVAGTTVTLDGIDNQGVVFDSWSGACTGTDRTCTVTLTATTSVMASHHMAMCQGCP